MYSFCVADVHVTVKNVTRIKSVTKEAQKCIRYMVALCPIFLSHFNHSWCF